MSGHRDGWDTCLTRWIDQRTAHLLPFFALLLHSEKTGWVCTFFCLTTSWQVDEQGGGTPNSRSLPRFNASTPSPVCALPQQHFSSQRKCVILGIQNSGTQRSGV